MFISSSRKPRTDGRRRLAKGLLIAVPALAATISFSLFLDRCKHEEPSNPSKPQITITDPHDEPSESVLLPPEPRVMPEETPQEARTERVAAPEQQSLFEAVEEEFGGGRIVCVRSSPSQDPAQMRLLRLRFNPNSTWLSDPSSDSSYTNPPIRLFEMLESEQDNERLFHILRYLDSIGVAEETGRSWRSKVQMYLLDRGRPDEGFYDPDCVARAGNALMAASRAITILLDRCIDNDGEGISELADRIPENLREIFYDRLSIMLFQNDANFDARFSARMLSGLNEDQKWAFFQRLFDFVFLNAFEDGSYRETARLVMGVTSDPVIRRGIDSIFDEVQRREANPLGH